MWHKKIELERMGCVCSGWANHQCSAGEGIHRWWEKIKQLTRSTQRLSFSKDNVRNVKHSDMFTHLSVIQIFRLRLGPDVHQIPSYPRGMVWPNLPQSMWPRLESREKKEECASASVCALHFKLPNVSILSNAATYQMPRDWRKPQHNFFIRSDTESSCIEHQRRRKPHDHIAWQYIRGRHAPHQPTACIWWQLRSDLLHYVLWYRNIQSQCIQTCRERSGI